MCLSHTRLCAGCKGPLQPQLLPFLDHRTYPSQVSPVHQVLTYEPLHMLFPLPGILSHLSSGFLLTSFKTQLRHKLPWEAIHDPQAGLHSFILHSKLPLPTSNTVNQQAAVLHAVIQDPRRRALSHLSGADDTCKEQTLSR